MDTLNLSIKPKIDVPNQVLKEILYSEVQSFDKT